MSANQAPAEVGRPDNAEPPVPGNGKPKENFDSSGRDILTAVQSVREVLKARGEALEAFRKVLVEQHRELEVSKAEFAEQQNELCDGFEAREGSLAQREDALHSLEKDLNAARSEHEQEVARFGNRHTELEDLSARLDIRGAALDERESAVDVRESASHKEFEGAREALASFEEDRNRLKSQNSQFDALRVRFEEERALWETQKAAHDAAAAQFQADRSKLDADREKLRNAHNLLNEKKGEIEVAEADLDERARLLEKETASLRASYEKELGGERAQLAELKAAAARERDQAVDARAQWRQKVEELDNAGDTLSSLQVALEAEVGSITDSSTDVLGDFELPSISTRSRGEDAVPSEAEEQAKAAVDRFQKLCRDARRRAIGLR
jgi:chromosome segregation ATPase